MKRTNKNIKQNIFMISSRSNSENQNYGDHYEQNISEIFTKRN